jgi:hypothetical protein
VEFVHSDVAYICVRGEDQGAGRSGHGRFILLHRTAGAGTRCNSSERRTDGLRLQLAGACVLLRHAAGAGRTGCGLDHSLQLTFPPPLLGSVNRPHRHDTCVSPPHSYNAARAYVAPRSHPRALTHAQLGPGREPVRPNTWLQEQDHAGSGDAPVRALRALRRGRARAHEATPLTSKPARARACTPAGTCGSHGFTNVNESRRYAGVSAAVLLMSGAAETPACT